MGEHNSAKEKSLYYCTKLTAFPKSVVLHHILTLFEKTDSKTLSITEVYMYLCTALCVKTVNRANLSALLEGKSIVNRDFVYGLFLVASEADYEAGIVKSKTNSTPSDSCPSASILKQTITFFGLEFVKAYLATDGVSFANFCLALQHVDKEYEPVERVNTRFSRSTLLSFIDTFSEDELLSILDEEESYRELYGLYMQDVAEKVKADNYLSSCKELINGVNIDNYNLNLKYIIPNAIAKILASVEVFRVGDFASLSDEKLLALRDEEKAIVSVLKRLQLSLSETLTVNFLTVITMSRKSGKVNSAWERYAEIMENRVNGATLEAAGSDYGITRERVRQIEAKYERAFSSFFANSSGSLSGILRAFAKNEFYISIEEIEKIIKKYSNVFIYFLKRTNREDIVFIDELHLFYFPDDIDWYSELLLISTQMPESLTEAEFNREVEKASRMFNELDYALPYDFCEKVLAQDYKKLGTIYSRTSMPLSKRYSIILCKYFADGMYIYDKEDLTRFREYYQKTFNDSKLPENDRAMYARIADVAILCGRGKYKPKQNKYTSEELCEDIYKYIMESDKEIFLTNTLFYVFEDRLLAEGIDNKYYLQGVLGECFKGKNLYFKRDYLSKSKEATSIYSAVVRFIRDAGRAVSKAEIKEEFPGIPEIVISIACSDENIVVGFASYSHVDTLKQHEEEIDELDAIMQKTVSDGQIHSCEDLLHFLTMMNKNLLDVFEIDNRYKLFSALKALFADKYELQRPFFAKKGVVIGKQEERVQEYLTDYDELEIDDLMDYIKENDFHYYSVMELIESLDGFIYKNHEELIRIERAGIDKYKMPYIEDFLDDILENEDFIVTTKIKGYGLLPKIGIEWNQWVLYGAVRKWSKNYKMLTTNNQFRTAVPIVVKEEIPAKTLDDLIKYEQNKLNLDERNMLRYMREKGLIE